jgi:hypothetical protein
MSYVLVYEYDPRNSEPRVFGPYDEVTDALAEAVHYFPQAELCPPTHVNMGDKIWPEALMVVLPLERLTDHVQDLRRQLYPDDAE